MISIDKMKLRKFHKIQGALTSMLLFFWKKWHGGKLPDFDNYTKPS